MTIENIQKVLLKQIDEKVYSCKSCDKLVDKFPNDSTVFIGKDQTIVLVGETPANNVVIAKNYLNKEEMESLELIVSAFLDLAENRTKKHIPMAMDDWSKRIEKIYYQSDKALSEFEKYRVIQDKILESYFDKFILDGASDNK